MSPDNWTKCPRCARVDPFGGKDSVKKCLNRDKVLGILAGAIQETRPYAGS